jgi:hypothetical protein
MSQMQIDQVLSQIRSFSAQGTARAASRTGCARRRLAQGVAGVGAPGAPAFGELLKQGIDAVNTQPAERQRAGRCL